MHSHLVACAALLCGCNLVTNPGQFTVSEAVGSWSGPLLDIKNVCLMSTAPQPCLCSGQQCSQPACAAQKCDYITELSVTGTMTLNGDGTGTADFQVTSDSSQSSLPGTLSWSPAPEEYALIFACLDPSACKQFPQKRSTVQLTCLNSDANTLACTIPNTALSGSLTREQ